jgi:hypothetical protein
MCPSTPASLVLMLSAFACACTSGEAPPKTPQTAATVDLDTEAARATASKAGILGVLNADGGGVTNVFGAGGLDTGLDDAKVLVGADGADASEGSPGFGSRGAGPGGGGTGEGTIGIGTIGPFGAGAGAGAGQGSGSGSGRLGGTQRRPPPVVVTGSSDVIGSLSREVVQRVVRQRLDKLRSCYETSLQKNPKLAGRVTTTFTIDPSGTVSTAQSESDLSDAAVLRCVETTFRSMTFPKPEKGGSVVVHYPVVFSSGDEARPPKK